MLFTTLEWFPIYDVHATAQQGVHVHLVNSEYDQKYFHDIYFEVFHYKRVMQKIKEIRMNTAF